MDDDQKNYMLTSKLMRNNIEYDITANDIGLDKIRLENYATWKSMGSLYTQRYDKQNKKWSANFMVPPMAGDSELESFAEFINGTKYTLVDEESIDIPITFGARMINLTDYAKENHVKKIQSELYINDELISSIDDKEKLEISNSLKYHVEKGQEENIIILNITVKSLLITKFTTDGALTDVKNYTIIIYCSEMNEEVEEEEDDKIVVEKVATESYAKKKEFPPPEIVSVEVNVLKSGKKKALNIPKRSNVEFVCAGQTIVVTAYIRNAPEYAWIEFQGDKSIKTFDNTTKNIEWDEPRKRNIPTFKESLSAYKEMYSDKIGMNKLKKNEDEDITVYELLYVIPYETKQTLNSWNTLRKNTKDAFKINEGKLFSRIASPYQIVVKTKNELGADTFRYQIDVIERWDTLYNRDLSDYVTGNYTEIGGR